ncbi:zona pellucida sperm-binding protein 1-like isoform X1 [Engraulis encrasicolus]|uniref:zona pellucida sperm-binding protein 1-like isoform X1 n=1 Tax=Engraulis encrasicolus TaxID=184585 RepID=UPI002FD3D5AA
MSVCRALLPLVLLVSAASASHFWGGTISFLPKGRNPDGSYRVDFRYKDVFDSCGSRLNWNCVSGNCGGQTDLEVGTIYSTSSRNPSNLNWCQEEGIVTRRLTSDKPFQLSASSCCWVTINNGGWSYPWGLPVMVDLGRRSDTNEPNHSPHTTIISFVRVPRNCPRTYNFIGCDPDHDDIKCRNAATLPTGFQIDQDTCNFHYSPTASTGMYSIRLEVEDYAKQYTTLTYNDGSRSYRTPYQPTSTASPISTTSTPAGSSPFSRLPLQFAVKVEPAVPSCSAGVYLPQFLHPTPADRERLHTAINQELEIRIRASASHSVIQDLIISGPLNITKTKTLSGEFIVTWTPSSDDDGEHFPICFIAESKAGSTLYQSEMRCVIVEVKHEQATIGNVICAESFMAIEVNKSQSEKINIHEDHLRLNDPSCTLYSNGTHVFANMSLNTCGTVMEEDETNVIFKNEIVSVDNPNDVITRHHQVEIQFFCKYPKKGSVTLEFDAHRSPFVFVQKGFGTFSYQFEFFHSSQFRNMEDPSTYPLEYDLGDMMYMQIEATSPVNNTELFVESCQASPSDDPNSHTSYSIISNGCIQDETLQFFSNHGNIVKFGMKAFKFIGLHDQVFITCSVILCEADNSNTRCSQGCMNTTAAPAAHHHHRREAPIQTISHFISQGPVRLSRSVNLKDAASTVTSNGLNMNIVFIAGCLLLAMGMLCGALIYTKRPKAAYQPLPTNDYQ